jgi:hypothetical protein
MSAESTSAEGAYALPQLAELGNPCRNFLREAIDEAGDVFKRVKLVVLDEGRQINSVNY